MLKDIIDKCCGEKQCCSTEDAKNEADKVVDALKSAWSANYGNGVREDKGPEVGGYLCYEWVLIFEQALNALDLKCLESKKMMAQMPQEGGAAPVHAYVKLYACQEKPECMVTFDDGFFNDGTSHTGEFPPKDSKYKENPRLRFPTDAELKEMRFKFIPYVLPNPKK